VHAVVARSTFPSQNGENTPKWRKHTMFGPVLEVDMSKKCTPLWREAHFQVKVLKADGLGALLEVDMSKKCTPLWREAHFEAKSAKKMRGNGALLDVRMSFCMAVTRDNCTLSKVSKM